MTMPDKPLITLACPTYGRVKHLQGVLKCFLDQDYQGPKEMLIFNSFPGQTLMCDTPNVRIVNAKVRPPTLGATRNVMLDWVKDGYVLCCDDDDLVMPEALTHYVNHFEQNPNAEWVQENRKFFAMGHKITGTEQTTWIGCLAYKKSAHLKIKFDEKLSVGEDQDYRNRMCDQLPGKWISVEDPNISTVYCWGNEAHHISGSTIGDRYGDCRQYLEGKIARNEEPAGEVRLNPAYFYDPIAMRREYFASLKK